MLLFFAVWAQTDCIPAVSLERQLNKVICLQNHETESFSSPHHCLCIALQVCVCERERERERERQSGKILFSNQLSPWRWLGPWDLGGLLPWRPKGHLTPITSDVMFTLQLNKEDKSECKEWSLVRLLNQNKENIWDNQSLWMPSIVNTGTWARQFQ